MKLRFDPWDVGWRIGDAHEPRGGELWVPWDRTAGVIGPQGSGKTLDLLTPALLGAPGAALVTLTKVEDLLLSLTERSRGDRPCVVLDPFGLAEGSRVDELIWDPIAGCVDPKVAERRAKAFTAGTVKGAINGGTGDEAARFYAAESAKVLQAYFHAAALTGKTLEDVLQWVANPTAATQPSEILRRHPHAEPFWHGLLHGALNGDDRTAGNTITTVQQAVSLFFQADIRRRCIPSPGRPATDLADVIRRRGTIYLLGREDPYASASPLMTAVAEHVLGHRPAAGQQLPVGRPAVPAAALGARRAALHRAAADPADPDGQRARTGALVHLGRPDPPPARPASSASTRPAPCSASPTSWSMFGGSKDVAFNQEISDLLGTVRVGRVTHHTGGFSGGGRSLSGDDIPIMRPEEVRQLPERQALVIAENGKPIIAKLHRCVEGKRRRTPAGRPAGAARRG